jgi:hypothetical protein
VTRANPERRRLNSINSAVTRGLLVALFSKPPRCSLTQFPTVCSTTLRLRDNVAWL